MDILMSTEESSMVGCWRVYLCLEFDLGQVVLSKRQYEALAECHEFGVEDEDGNVEYVLPEKIGESVVVGLENDMVVGGGLQYFDENDVIRLDAGAMDAARIWCADHGFDRSKDFPGAWQKIEQALSAPVSNRTDAAPTAAFTIGGVTPLRIRLKRWMDVPATAENDYPAEVIKDGDKFTYKARGVVISITPDEAVEVISNPFLYYFSTASRLHNRINKAREGLSGEGPGRA